MQSEQSKDDNEGSGLIAWVPAERESFFRAIERHRQASARISVACAFAAAMAFLVFPLVLLPFFCTLTVLLFDVLNYFWTMPNLAPEALSLWNAGVTLVAALAGYFDKSAVGSPDLTVVTWQQLKPSLPLFTFSLIPSFVFLVLLAAAVTRALKLSPLFDVTTPTGRALKTTDLQEQRLRNTIDEMALAASLPPPRIAVIEGGKNAGVLGTNQLHATVVIGSTILAGMNRDQTQALAAMLVSSIANGDLSIGYRTTVLMRFFALIQRCGTGFIFPASYGRTRKLIHAILFPSKSTAYFVLNELENPLDIENDPLILNSKSSRPSRITRYIQTLFTIAMFPIGTAALTVSLLNIVGLDAGLSFLWRQRKFMMDAVAVKFSRNPNALVSALSHSESRAGDIADVIWASHMYVLSPSLKHNIDRVATNHRTLPLPSVETRQKALVTMGASNIAIKQATWRSVPLKTWLMLSVLVPLLIVSMIVLIVGMFGLSLGFSTAISVLPGYFVHSILR